jgi:hypothetical protein
MAEDMKTVIGADGVQREVPLSEADKAQRVIDAEHNAARMVERTKEAINAERDRRVAKGFQFEGKLYQSRVEDQKRITNASTQAVAAIQSGAQSGNLRWHGGGKDFGWLADDNTLTPMDAQQVLALSKAATAWETEHVFAARAIKSTNPVPTNFTDDSYWPA